MKDKNFDKKDKKNSFLVLTILACVALLIYIGWRVIYTLPDYRIYGWVAFIAGIGLLLAEALSVVEAIVHFWDLNHQYVLPMPVIPEEWYPEIDVMIATHNEDEELLFKTANACTRMKYPDKSKVHIHICDDTNRPEIKAMAKRLGVNYFGLSDNVYAKAGNLNNAIGKTNAPLIVTFDADMIPNSEFLMETVPYFFLPRMKQDENGTWIAKTEDEIDENDKIGFIQTPQSFYNPDLFQYNLYSEGKIPNEQDYFFRDINVGKNNSNAPIYAGSNTVISREALEAVGGICTGTITEDFETGLLIEAKGYKCYAIDKLLAKGLAPITITSLIKQRERWARGCIYSLRRVRLLVNPEINFKIKVAYFACRIYWGSFTRRFMYILAPILFALFNVPVVICGLKGILFVWLPSYLIYGYASRKATGEIRNTRWSNIIDTTIFPYLLLPIWAESCFIRKKEFSVTSKKKVQNESSAYMALPHMVLLALCVYALVVMVKDLVMYRAFGSIVVIYWLLVNCSSLLMATFFMLGRKNERMTERFSVELPLEVHYDDKVYQGTVVDISEGGFAFVLDSAVYLPHNEEMDAEYYIQYNEYYAKVKGKIVTVIKKRGDSNWKYCVSITDMDEENKQEYLQIIYDREHTLPKVLSKGSTYFGDIITNLSKRTQAQRSESRRQTARIPVNKVYESENGTKVKLENYNFEFVRLSAPGGGSLPEEFILFPKSGYEMHCKRSSINPNVYAIINRKELNDNKEFVKIVEEWSKNAK